MAFIDWTDELSINIPSIDRQHQTLVGYINKLEEAISNGDATQALGFILNALVRYTQVHFIYEEMLFDRYTYEQTDDHCMAHQKLLNKVGEYKTRFETGDAEVGQELLEFLKNWLSKHILQEDKAYSAYLIAKGVK